MTQASEQIARQYANGAINKRTWGDILYNVKVYGAVGDGTIDDSAAIESIINTVSVANVTFPNGDYRITNDITLPVDFLFELYSAAQLDITSGKHITASPLTHTGGKYGRSFRNSGYSGNDIYNKIFGGVEHYDVLQGVAHIAYGSNIEHAAGLSGYVLNESDGTNGVALYGCGIASKDTGRVWGINTLLQDSDVRVAGTATGRILMNELDFNVMNPGTEVVGMSVGGNSIAQPTNASGFIANSLGSGIKWSTGFFAMDEACVTALFVGRSESGVSKPSQKITFRSTNSLGNDVFNHIYSGYDGWLFVESSVFKITNGSLFLDTLRGVYVNGNKIIGDQQPAIANASAGTEVTTINAILTALRNHGVIAT